MVLNYYSILSKAIRGKDAAARLSLYDEARALVARLRVGPNHTEEDIAAQSDALESAISQIEADVAASYREETGTERLDSVLSSGPSWGRIAATVLAVIATIGLAASAYWYVTARGGRTAIESARAPSRPSTRTNIDPVVEDLKPGVDGGSSAEVLPFSLQRQVTYYRTTVVPGSIVVDRENRFLYLIQWTTPLAATASASVRSACGPAVFSASPARWNGRNGAIRQATRNPPASRLKSWRAGRAIRSERERSCSINPGCSSTAPTRRGRSVISL